MACFLFNPIARDIDLGVEVLFQAVLQLDAFAFWIGWDRKVQQTLIDNFVVIFVSFALVEQVNLQGQEGQLQSLGDKCESLRCILLFQQLCIFPTAGSQRILYKLSLPLPSARARTVTAPE